MLHFAAKSDFAYCKGKEVTEKGKSGKVTISEVVKIKQFAPAARDR
jgi:hypothetical protein